MLCDGDCGNCYHEEDMNFTAYGENLCKKCMFIFIAGQGHTRKPRENEAY